MTASPSSRLAGRGADRRPRVAGPDDDRGRQDDGAARLRLLAAADGGRRRGIPLTAAMELRMSRRVAV